MVSKYTEDELLNALRRNDQEAFSYLFDHYAPALNGIVMRSYLDNPSSEIILQKIFKKIWQSISHFDKTKETLFNWMANITKTTLKEFSHGHPEKLPGLKLADKLESENILLLAYSSRYTQEELAGLINQSVPMMKANIRLAIGAIRQSTEHISAIY